MKRMSPLAAFSGGLAAGFIGAVAQNVFFALTKRWAPSSPEHGFQPPDALKEKEPPTQIVARRMVAGLAQRGPVQPSPVNAQAVHYAYGSAWGAAYGIGAGSFEALRTPAGGLGFGTVVWMASDNMILPLFRLSAWPQHYPLKTHLYALAAHLAYGMGVQLAFRALERERYTLLAWAGAAWLTRRAPRFVRPTARRAARRGIRYALPARELMQALSA